MACMTLPRPEFSRVAGSVEAQFDDVRVVLNRDLEYVGIDAVGQRIWDLLATPRTLDDLVSRLVQEYEVTRETCERDVSGFIEALEHHGLVARR